MYRVLSRRYFPMRRGSGWVRIEKHSDGGTGIEVHVLPSRARRIAELGNIPAGRGWELHLHDTILWAVVYDAEQTSDILTRRQLLRELDKLRRLDGRSEVPSIPDPLRRDLHFFEDQRIKSSFGLGGIAAGQRPVKVCDSEDAAKVFAAFDRAYQEANIRVERSLVDPVVMRELAGDLHDHLSATLATRDEELAATRALDLARRHIAERMWDFWTISLGEPPRITKRLIAITSAVYEPMFRPLSPDAVKKQLQEARGRDRESTAALGGRDAP